jgi:hypothetical protein
VRLRYKQDYEAGRVGNGVYSRSGRNLPPHASRLGGLLKYYCRAA